MKTLIRPKGPHLVVIEPIVDCCTVLVSLHTLSSSFNNNLSASFVSELDDNMD